VEQPRIDVNAATLRLMIITSFLAGSTTVLLTLNVNIIRQSVTAGQPGLAEWLLAASILLMLLASLIMMFMSSVMLGTMYLAPFTQAEQLRIVAKARSFLGLSSTLILTSFGSTFLVSFGLNSAGGWFLGSIGYGSGLFWALLRGYYLTKFVHPRQPKSD